MSIKFNPVSSVTFTLKLSLRFKMQSLRVSGERYDFVLEASGKPRSYWIHVKTIGNCEELQLYTLGILRYNGAKINTLTDPGYMAHPGGKVCIVPWRFL